MFIFILDIPSNPTHLDGCVVADRALLVMDLYSFMLQEPLICHFTFPGKKHMPFGAYSREHGDSDSISTHQINEFQLISSKLKISQCTTCQLNVQKFDIFSAGKHPISTSAKKKVSKN